MDYYYIKRVYNVFNIYHKECLKVYSMYSQYYIGKTSSKILWSQNRNRGAKHNTISILRV